MSLFNALMSGQPLLGVQGRTVGSEFVEDVRDLPSSAKSEWLRLESQGLRSSSGLGPRDLCAVVTEYNCGCLFTTLQYVENDPPKVRHSLTWDRSPNCRAKHGSSDECKTSVG